jgi:DNA-directed RNA polymerase alpha subunit
LAILQKRSIWFAGIGWVNYLVLRSSIKGVDHEHASCSISRRCCRPNRYGDLEHEKEERHNSTRRLTSLARENRRSTCREAKHDVDYTVISYKRFDRLFLSSQTTCSLKQNKIIYVGDSVCKSEAELLGLPTFNPGSLSEVKELLAQTEGTGPL